MEVFCEPSILVRVSESNLTHRNLHLTNMDQVYSYYRSMILVYRGSGHEVKEEAAHPAEAIKRGVEETLAHYPWAAGRLHLLPGAVVVDAVNGVEERRDGLEIRCNVDHDDSGIQFVRAHASCALADLGDLADPNPAFKPLFATVDLNAPLHSRPLVALQVTRFQDGGVCVSVNSHHALFDGTAAAIFIRNICSCARGEGVCAHMDTAPRELRVKAAPVPLQGRWPSYVQWQLATKDLRAEHQLWHSQPLAATRFIFSNEDVAKLRLEALSKQHDLLSIGRSGFTACSRFEALAAHLWKAKAKSLSCAATSIKDQEQGAAGEESLPLCIAVNVRGRIVESIPVSYMGTASSRAIAWATVEELREKSLAFAVERIKEAMREVSAERFGREVNFTGAMVAGGGAHLLPAMCTTITSLARMGFWEADFGRGKPAFFGHPHEQRRNLIAICEGDALSSSFNVLASFASDLQRRTFQQALQLQLS